MQNPTPETLRQSARRCHELSASLADPADRSALEDRAEVLNQQARDLEHANPAPAPSGGAH